MDIKPTYDELKAKCDDFQAQIIRFLKVEQELIDARSKLDRDLSRFKSIQTYSQKVLGAVSLEEFANITVESVVETFEVECSVLLVYDKEADALNIQSSFGFDEESYNGCRLDSEWISSKGLMKNGEVIIEHVDPGSKPFGEAGLYKVIFSPYYDENGIFHGLLIGGVSNSKKAYYDEIAEQLIPSFMVFTQQMSEMLKNLEAKRSLDRKVRERTEQVIKQKEEIEIINEELTSQKNELQIILENLKQAQAQLVQSEKMASLGQLVAGIAHEINNPVNFISAGVESLSMNLEEIGQVLERYNRITASNVKEKLKEINELKQNIEYKEAIREINKLIDSIKNGVNRTTEIVKGLRTFSRLDEDVLKTTDIHEGINSTLILLHNKYKNRIEIIKKYKKIPLIECFPGQINQVFMNILSNAIDAIEGNGTITICTSLSGENVRISIRDTGNGIQKNLREKIFDPFFTTKEVGKGTGLGLSITQSIIEKHKGKIEVKSEPGNGTEFIILLPVNQSDK
ncbi:MAG: GHKL domain-containing protein [Bacteroidales bacterium]|nr:GHKL domain-containing protein [Bacteroidales bacterium]